MITRLSLLPLGQRDNARSFLLVQMVFTEENSEGGHQDGLRHLPATQMNGICTVDERDFRGRGTNSGSDADDGADFGFDEIEDAVDRRAGAIGIGGENGVSEIAMRGVRVASDSWRTLRAAGKMNGA